jgi:hypothetical protein
MNARVREGTLLGGLPYLAVGEGPPHHHGRHRNSACRSPRGSIWSAGERDRSLLAPVPNPVGEAVRGGSIPATGWAGTPIKFGVSSGTRMGPGVARERAANPHLRGEPHKSSWTGLTHQAKKRSLAKKVAQDHLPLRRMCSTPGCGRGGRAARGRQHEAQHRAHFDYAYR